MTRWLEISLFVALALVLHIAVFATPPARGAQSQGAGGEAQTSLQGASAQMAAIVQEWETPPTQQQTIDTAPTPPSLPTPDIPTFTAPEAPAVPRDLPQMIPQSASDVAPAVIETQPAEPPQRYAPTASVRPQARPPQRAQPSAPRAEQQAAGSGGGARAGQAQTAVAPALSPGQEAELKSVWGAQIFRQIERRKRAPRNQRRSGEVRVTLSVGRGGQLLSSAVSQSSGVPAFDQAALQAIARAAPFPSAPAELPQGSYRFGLIIEFWQVRP
ncbi:MAG: TonB family protein [Pseudomonadota bacterium]